MATLQLNKYKQPWPFTEEQYPHQPQSPSEWWSKHFQEQAQMYGCPFLELCESEEGYNKINPISPNLDFLAACLGGDKQLGHSVVYFEPEMQFYYYEPILKRYQPVSDAKLGNLVRALLVRCAEELPCSVHLLNLFVEFRSDKVVKQIIHRAKSILAADYSFFGVDSKNERVKGPELHERVVKEFVESVLERRDGEFLTLSKAYVVFCELLRERSMSLIERSKFKEILAPLVKETFDLGIRNDIVSPDTQKQGAGWKGLSVAGAV